MTLVVGCEPIPRPRVVLLPQLPTDPHVLMPATLSKADVLKAVEGLPDEEPLKMSSNVLVQTGLEEDVRAIPHDRVVEEFAKPRDEREWT